MINFLKKDIIVLSRDKAELITLLLVPFILIGILGFALKGLFEGDVSSLQIPVAIVKEDDEEKGLEEFSASLEEMDISDEEIFYLQNVAIQIHPVRILEELFSDELAGTIEVFPMNKAEAEEALANEEVVAILTIPDNFTKESLQKMIFDKGDGADIKITANDTASFSFQLFNDVMNAFVNRLNMETAIANLFEGEVPEANDDIGGIETVTKKDPVSAFQYYTIGVGVMFVLMLGGSIASKAYIENKQHVFHRILLSGSRPYAYLTGKGISAIIVAFIQLMILFLLASIVFQVFSLSDLQFWLGMIGITFVLSVCVASFATLITAITLRYNNEAIPAIFSGGIVTIFAFVGGSFFPRARLPEIMIEIGNWTPNGAAFTAYLQWIQGYGLSVVIEPLSRIIVMTLLLFFVSIFAFPKRRSA